MNAPPRAYQSNSSFNPNLNLFKPKQGKVKTNLVPNFLKNQRPKYKKSYRSENEKEQKENLYKTSKKGKKRNVVRWSSLTWKKRKKKAKEECSAVDLLRFGVSPYGNLRGVTWRWWEGGQALMVKQSCQFAIYSKSKPLNISNNKRSRKMEQESRRTSSLRGTSFLKPSLPPKVEALNHEEIEQAVNLCSSIDTRLTLIPNLSGFCLSESNPQIFANLISEYVSVIFMIEVYDVWSNYYLNGLFMVIEGNQNVDKSRSRISSVILYTATKIKNNSINRSYNEEDKTYILLLKHKFSKGSKNMNVSSPSFKDKVCETQTEKEASEGGKKNAVELENSSGGNQKSENEKEKNKEVDEKPKIDKGKAPLVEDMDFKNYLMQLSKVKSDFSKIKDSSLMGRIFAVHMDFNRVRAKLFSEWKNIKGEVTIIPRPNNWFEINFSNPVDKAMIWDKRPYHVFGHLLILRTWKPNFNVYTENTTSIDVWARIPLLPMEYVNKEAIRMIIEYNKIGKFIRLDSFSEKGMGISYARICMNIDFEEKPDGYVPIPDDNGNPVNHVIWFEDFSIGCGFCGNEEHAFERCPLRLAPARRTNYTIRKNNKGKGTKEKSSSKNEEDKEWTNVEGHKKKKKTPAVVIGGVKPYLAKGSGISISFIDGSSQSSKSSSKESKNANPEKQEEMKCIAVNHGEEKDGKAAMAPMQPFQPFLSTLDTSKEDEAFAAAMIVDPENEILAKNLLLNGALGASLLQTTMAPIDVGTLISESSFHSFHTNSTMHMQLEALEVKSDASKTESGKKKKYGGLEDSASSAMKGTKKQKT